jgi:hypothetical protein
MTTAAWAGMSVAQLAAGATQPPAPAPAPANQFVTVQEVGKPGQKCAVLETWITAEGHKAYKVKDVVTGEVMTVVEYDPVIEPVVAPTPGRAHRVAARFFHWHRDACPPDGSPMPPSVVVETIPATAPGDASGTMIVDQGCCDCDCNPTGPVTPVPAPPGGLMHRLFAGRPQGGSEQVVTTEVVTCPVQTVSPAATPPQAAQAPADVLQQPDQFAAKPAGPKTLPAAAPAHRPRTLVEALQNMFGHGKQAAPASKAKESADTPPAAVQQAKAPADPPKPPKAKAPAETPKPPPEAVKIVVHTPPPPPAKAMPVGPAESRPAHKAVPLGVESVYAASGGMPMHDRYIPVPVVTLPGRTKPPEPTFPEPPKAEVPEAPQLNAKINAMQLNAFTPAEVIKQMAHSQDGAFPGDQPPPEYAFYRTVPPSTYMNPAYGVNPAYAYAYAWGKASRGPGILPATPYGPFPPPMMQQQAMYLAMMQQQAGYGGYNSYAAIQPAAAPPNALLLPPNPYTVAPVVPVTAGYGGSAGVVPASYSVPEAAPAATTAAPSIPQMLDTLHDSLYPSQRESAADGLSACDPMTHPHVVQALLQGAAHDGAATVRAACVRALAKMNANTPTVIRAIAALKADGDPRVQEAVEQALATLK